MKFIYQPVRPFRVGQTFGQNLACVDLATNSKVISCDGYNPPPGYKSLYGKNGHTGIDLSANHGQPVYCACGGIVDSIDTEPRTGLDVRVISEIEGVKYKHVYEHLLGYQSKKGDKIETGDLIGWADNTGYSSGDHLHFGVYRLEKSKWVPVDPLPIMFSDFALHVSVLKTLKEKVALLAELVADFLRKKRK